MSVPRRRFLSPGTQISAPAVDTRAMAPGVLREMMGGDAAAATAQRAEDANQAAFEQVQRQDAMAQRAADREQAAAEDQRMRDAKSAQEAEFRRRGVEHFTDANGQLQPVMDAEGKPRFKTVEGPEQVDPKTKKVFRTDFEGGQPKQVWVDADAPIGPGKDKADKFIYRQNKKSEWDKIDPEQGLNDADERVRSASAAALRARALEEKKRGLALLDIEDDESRAKSGRPTDRELETASYDVTSEDPATKARGQAVLDREKAFAERAGKKAALRREMLDLESLSDEDFARKMREKSTKGLTPGQQAEAMRPMEALRSRKSALDEEGKKLAEEGARLKAAAAQGLTAAESLQAAPAAADYQRRAEAHQAATDAHNKEVERANEWQQKQAEEKRAAEAAGVTPPAPPVSGPSVQAAPAKVKTRSFGVVEQPNAVEVQETDAQAALKDSSLAGKDVYLKPSEDRLKALKVIESGTIDEKGNVQLSTDMHELDGPGFEKVPETPEQMKAMKERRIKRTGAFDVEWARGSAEARLMAPQKEAEMLNRERERETDRYRRHAEEMAKKVASGQMSGAEMDATLKNMEQGFANDFGSRFEDLGRKALDLRKYAFAGAVPINRVVDLFKAAGGVVKDVPRIEDVLNAAGPEDAQSFDVQRKRQAAFENYVREYGDQPLFDETSVEGWGSRVIQRAKSEWLREQPGKGWEEHGALGYMGGWGYRARAFFGNIKDQYIGKSYNDMMAAYNASSIFGAPDMGEAINHLMASRKAVERSEARGTVGGGFQKPQYWSKDWFLDTIGNVIPSVAETLVVAGAGSLAGAAVGSVVPGAGTAGGGVEGFMAGLFGKAAMKRMIAEEAAAIMAAKGISKYAATRSASRLMMGRLLAEKGTGEVTKGMIRGAAELGAKYGGFLSSIRQNGAEYLGNMLDSMSPEEFAQPGAVDRAILISAAAGIPAGALDVVGIEGSTVQKLFGQSSLKAVRQGMKNASLRWAKDLLGGVSKEALTGLGQGMLGVAAMQQFKEGRIRSNLTDAEKQELWDNALGEAVGGGVFAAAGTLKSIGQRWKLAQTQKQYTVAARLSDIGTDADALAAMVSERTGETVNGAQVAAGIALAGNPAESGEVKGIDRSLVSLEAKFQEAFNEGDWQRARGIREIQSNLHKMRRQAAETHVFQAMQAAAELDAAQKRIQDQQAWSVSQLDMASAEALQPELDAVFRARGIVRIASGADLLTLPDAEVRALGYERQTDGSVKPMKDAIPAVTMGPGGTWVITDAAIAEAEGVSPAAAAMVGDDEYTVRMRDAVQAIAKEQAPAQGKAAGRRWGVTVKSPSGAERVVEVTAESAQAAKSQVAGMDLKGGLVGDVEEISGSATAADSGNPTAGSNGAQGDPATGNVGPIETGPAGKLESLARGFGAVFTGVRRSDDRNISGGAWFDPKTGELVISEYDLKGNLALAKDPDKYLLALVAEEAIHAAAVRLEKEGWQDLARLWKRLPAGVKEAFREAYPTESEFKARHEFLAMVIQGKVTFSAEGITVDGMTLLQMTPESLEAAQSGLVQILERLLEFIRDLRKGLDAETAAAVDAAADKVVETIRQLQGATVPATGTAQDSSARSEREIHNLEAAGSSPAPATNAGTSVTTLKTGTGTAGESPAPAPVFNEPPAPDIGPAEPAITEPVADAVAPEAEAIRAKIEAAKKKPESQRIKARQEILDEIAASSISPEDAQVLEAEAETIAPDGSEGRRLTFDAFDGLFSRRTAPASRSELASRPVLQHVVKGGEVVGEPQVMDDETLKERLQEHNRMLAVYRKIIDCLTAA